MVPLCFSGIHSTVVIPVNLSMLIIRGAVLLNSFVPGGDDLGKLLRSPDLELKQVLLPLRIRGQFYSSHFSILLESHQADGV